MKKTLLGLVALTALSTASADKVGAYLFGVQYTQQQANGNAMRYSVGVPAVSLFRGGGAIGASGDVAYLMPLKTGDTSSTLNPYWGGSLGIGGVFGSVDVNGSKVSYSSIAVVPSVLVGAEYGINSDWSVFLEGSLGYGIAISSSNLTGAVSADGFAPGLRLGVNYNLK